MKSKFLRIITTIVLSVSVMLGSALNAYAAGDERQPSDFSKAEFASREYFERDRYLEASEAPLGTHISKPITSIDTQKGFAKYKYDVNNNLVSKTTGDKTTHYVEDNGKIISVNSPSNNYILRYALVEGEEKCVGISLNNKEYSFEYQDGNVSLIKCGGNIVCKYDYSENSVIPAIYEMSTDMSNIGHINPIRYQGWFYDDEVDVFYLGQGVFYDANEQRFIQNKFSFNSTHDAGKGASVMATTNDLIENTYQDLMNDPTYGSRTCKAGNKWYSSLSAIEVIARCIYAENTGMDRLDDRIAETVVIMNRMVRDRKNAYGVVTAPSQFTTICSSNPKSNSLNAKSKTNTAWQQATLLACIAYYGSSRSNISSFYRIPAGISTQYYFRGLGSVTFEYENAGINVAGEVRKNVVITGYGTITTANDVDKAKKLSGYNIFFNDIND